MDTYNNLYIRNIIGKKLINNFNFKLTENQIRVVNEINDDLKSNYYPL